VLVDFHIHSRSSDGTMSARQIADLVLTRNVAIAIITDHDLVGESEILTQLLPDRAVVGIELSTVWQGRCVDLLGYRLAGAHLLDDPARLRRNEELVCALGAAAVRRCGFALDDPDFDDLEGAHSTVLLAGGVFAQSANHARLAAEGIDNPEAFKLRYLSKGAPASFQRDFARNADLPTTAEGIERIIAAGGVAVLAHPGLIELADLEGQIRLWAPAGLAGIEVDHTDHSDATRARFEQLALKLDLLTTYGSDTHSELDHFAAPAHPWSEAQVMFWREMLDLDR
jgi:predicted metal-dependent phosphoesterase TrpH